jgi:hypothetical protein
MNRPRLFKILRIVFSAVCGVACVLLIALWVRSYRTVDLILWPVTSSMPSIVESIHGTWYVAKYDCAGPISERIFQTMPIRDEKLVQIDLHNFAPHGFACSFAANSYSAYVPQWFPILVIGVFGILTAVPWPPWRFSLRTLLIVTTLVAAVLGAVVYFA